MGLADALDAFSRTGLAAGLGQGLATGVQNYNQGLEQQRIVARQADIDRRARLKDEAEMYKGLMAGAVQAGNNEQAAGYVPAYREALSGLAGRPVNIPDVLGALVPAQPAQAATPMGPQWNGEAMGLAARPAAPEHRDFSTQPTTDMLYGLAGLAPPKPVEVSPGATLYDPRSKKALFTAPNPWKLTADQQLTLQDVKGQQASQRDAARMAVAQFTQSEIGKRFAASLQSKEYLASARQDPAKHYATIVAMAKTLAGPRDLTDIDGSQQAAKIQSLVDAMSQDPRFSLSAPGDTSQGGSPTGRTPFPRK